MADYCCSALESKRIPAVMKHPAFQQNAWATIRMHAANSIVMTDKAKAGQPRPPKLNDMNDVKMS